MQNKSLDEVITRGGVSSTRGLGPTMTARGLGLTMTTRDLGPTMTARGLGLTMTTRDLGPTMTARGQNISISISMLPQTLIMSRLDQLSWLGTWIYFFSLFIIFFPFGATWRWLRYKIHPSTTLRNFTLKNDSKRSMYQHFQFTGEYSLTDL
jgi:hypothetical protein